MSTIMTGKITTSQFFILYFLSSTYYLSTISSEALRDNFSDSLISALLSGLLGIVLSLPLLSLHDKNGETSIQYKIRRDFGGFAKVLFVFYMVYFIVSDVIILALMQSLLTSTIFSTVPPLLIGFMAMLVAYYGACKGLETVARAGLIAFVIMLLGTILIFLGVLPVFNFNNREIMFYKGFGDVGINTITIFARSTFLPQMVLLLSSVQGKITKASFWWTGGVAVLSWSVIIFIIHSLGGFAGTQLFPVYTLSAVSQLAPLQRLDIVFTLIWLTTLTIRLSCDLLAIQACLKTSVALKRSRYIIGGVGMLILVLAVCITDNYFITGMIYSGFFMTIPAVLLGFGIPLYIKIKERKLR